MKRGKNYGESIGYNITISNTKERKTNVNIGETSFVQNYHIVKPKGIGIKNIFKGAYERPEKYVPRNITRKVKKNYK